MDSYGFHFGEFAESSRVGADGGVAMAALAAYASASGALGLPLSWIGWHHVPWRPGQAKNCGVVALGSSGGRVSTSPLTNSFKPNWLRQSAYFVG